MDNNLSGILPPPDNSTAEEYLGSSDYLIRRITILRETGPVISHPHKYFTMSCDSGQPARKSVPDTRELKKDITLSG
jgi:hypothetical protein